MSGPQPCASMAWGMPMVTVATTRLRRGSILEMVPSPELGTQTAPAPTTGATGRSPTLILATSLAAGLGWADGELAPLGTTWQPASWIAVHTAAATAPIRMVPGLKGTRPAAGAGRVRWPSTG